MASNGTCAVDDCSRPVHGRGLCAAHYKRWASSGVIGGPIAKRPSKNLNASCSIDGCDRPAVTRLLCALHYQRWHEHGDPYFTSRPRQGTRRTKDTSGYIRVRAPEHPLASKNGWVLEHRMVVYDAGIDIPPGHHVHHKNHIRDDNRLENLEVVSEADHHRGHMAVGNTVRNQYGEFTVDPERNRILRRERQRERRRAKREAARITNRPNHAGARVLPTEP